MPETDQIEKAVVSIWKDGVGKTFAGTAFFISTYILLTAKHVINNIKSDTIFLAGIQGVTQIPVKKQNIHLHEELDIAMIVIDMPIDGAEWVGLTLDKRGYEGEKCDFYAFSKFSEKLDRHKNHTVGTADGWYTYYCDHQVLKGFSGGIVAVADENRGFAIVIQRHKTDQQTRILPLYRVKRWLKSTNENLEHPCKVLRSYFLEKQQENNDVPFDVNSLLMKLSIFIDRPKAAYQSIIDKYNSCNSQIHASLCLFFSNSEDKPAEYISALGMKLQEQAADEQISLVEIVNESNFYAKDIPSNLLIAAKYDDFYRDFMGQIIEELQSGNDNLSTEETIGNNEKELEKTFLQLHSSQTEPKIFVVTVTGISKNFWKRIYTRRRLTQKYTWLEKFNNQCEQLIKDSSLVSQYPLLILFRVENDPHILKTKNNVVLLNIDVDDLVNWKIFLQKVLNPRQHLISENTFSLTNDFQAKLEKKLKDDKINFPVSYKQYRDCVKKTVILKATD